MTNAVIEFLVWMRRSSFRQETEKRLEEAARRKAAEEKEKAEQRHRRTEYK